MNIAANNLIPQTDGILLLSKNWEILKLAAINDVSLSFLLENKI